MLIFIFHFLKVLTNYLQTKQILILLTQWQCSSLHSVIHSGNLPFRPFGGRRNKETMYYITTKKASGVISGVQTAENGPIQWSRELPNSCLLSQGIKKHLTPILAGLLEVNPQKMWTFEKFFNEVTNLLGKKKVFLYFMNKLAAHRY